MDVRRGTTNVSPGRLAASLLVLLGVRGLGGTIGRAKGQADPGVARTFTDAGERT